MSGDVKLEPCPHCGSDSCRVIGGPGTRGGPKYWAGCDHCNGRAWGDSQSEAIAAWNRRSSSAAERAVVEALMDATAHLAGSASAYRKYARRHSSVGRSEIDPFFTTRVDDFDKAAERARLALSSVRGEGGDKQATRASGPTAPISTDTKGTTE